RSSSTSRSCDVHSGGSRSLAGAPPAGRGTARRPRVRGGTAHPVPGAAGRLGRRDRPRWTVHTGRCGGLGGRPGRAGGGGDGGAGAAAAGRGGVRAVRAGAGAAAAARLAGRRTADAGGGVPVPGGPAGST